MIVKFHLPSPPLSRYVKSITYFDGYDPPHRVERYIPNGGIEIVIDLKEKPQFVYDETGSERIQKCRRSWVSGMRTEFISIQAGNNSSMMVIDLIAGSTSPFFQFSMLEISDQVLDGDAVFGRSIDDLRNRIQNTAEIGDKISAAEEWLLEFVRSAADSNSIARLGVEVISQNPTTVGIDSVSKLAGITNKHLIHAFKKEIGITPKQFQRVQRFQSTVTTLHQQGCVGWTALALDCGFYDQSHFVNEFKRFSGLQPSTYLDMKGENAFYIPIR